MKLNRFKQQQQTNILVILLLWLVSLTTHAGLASYSLSGLPKDMQKNVESRLNPLDKKNKLQQLSDSQLSEQIQLSLQPFGYFHPQINIRRQGRLQITVTPGRPLRVRQFRLQLQGEGRDNPDLQQIAHQNSLKVGEVLNMRQYNQLKEDLLTAAEHQGYLRAQFSTAKILIDTPRENANIDLLFDTGPIFYFGQVQFDPTYISPELLHRYIPFHPGQAYSTDEVLNFNHQLSNSGYFSNVVVKPDLHQGQTVPIQVNLTPAPRYSYSLGIGFGTDTGIRGTAAYHVNPVNRKGHRLNALAQGSYRQNSLQLQYLIPGANPISDKYSLSANGGNLNYNSGYSNALLLSAAQQHQQANYQRTLSLNGLYEQFFYTDQPEYRSGLLFPKGSWSLANTHNQLFTPSGYNLSLNLLGSYQGLLSDLSFGQAAVDLRVAYTLAPWRTRFLIHGIQGYTAIDQIDRLPLSLALMLGGNENLKGYSFNSIGPGKIASYGGLEIQKEVREHWYLIGFVDAGNVYNPGEHDFLYDVGGGLMWVSPLGPVKVGLAQPTNNQLNPLGGTSPRLVINIGPDL